MESMGPAAASAEEARFDGDSSADQRNAGVRASTNTLVAQPGPGVSPSPEYQKVPTAAEMRAALYEGPLDHLVTGNTNQTVPQVDARGVEADDADQQAENARRDAERSQQQARADAERLARQAQEDAVRAAEAEKAKKAAEDRLAAETAARAKVQHRKDTAMVLAGLLRMVLIPGSLLWAFLAGVGRRVVGVGPFQLKAVAIKQDACPGNDTTIAIDVLGACGHPQFLAADSVHLLDPLSDYKEVPKVSNNDGTWTVNPDNTIQLARSASSTAADATVRYHLNGQGDGLCVSYAAAITVSFPGSPVQTTTILAGLVPSTVVSQSTAQGVAAVAIVTTADGSVLPPGETLTFQLSDQTGAAVGMPVNATISAGMASGGITVPASQAPGAYQVSASYGGRCSLSPSASASQTLTVAGIVGTTTTVTPPASINTSSTDQTVTLTVTVTAPNFDELPNAGTVTVTLTDSMNHTIGPGGSASVMMGMATVPLNVPSTIVAGTYNIVATYSGDTTTFDKSTSPRVNLTVVLLELTMTALETDPADPASASDPASLSFSTSAQSVNAIATLNSPTAFTTAPTGTVTFELLDGNNNPVPNASASGTVSFDTTTNAYEAKAALPVPAGTVAGNYYATATYSGDSTYQGSSSDMLAINVTTPVAVTAIPPVSPIPFSTSAQTVMVSATLTPVPTSGTVTFTLTKHNGTKVIATSMTSATGMTSVTGNSATVQGSITLPAGEHGRFDLTAAFSGSLYTSQPSAAVEFEVTSPTAPMITAQPMNMMVAPGANATFTAAASNYTSVQWQVSSGGAAFTDITGATMPSLSLSSVTTSMDGNQYQAVFTNSAGTSATASAALTVAAMSGTQPGFTLAATGVTAMAGGAPGVTTVTITAVNGFSDSVTLTVPNLPNMCTYQVNSGGPAMAGSVQISINVYSGAATGTSTVTVNGVSGAGSGSLTAATGFSLTITPFVMTMARHRLAAANVTRGRSAGFNVLSHAISTHAPDPKSVLLKGIQDIGMDKPAASALVKKGGKAMRVVDEGVWMVDDTGLIVFHADDALLHPPTPAIYSFADRKGNLSNDALLVVDENLTRMNGALASLKELTDDDFWKEFRKHAIDEPYPGEDPMPTLAPETFLLALVTLANGHEAILGWTGLDPVSKPAFDARYTSWVSGAQDQADLLSICEKLVHKNISPKAPPLQERYWRLAYMSRMMTRSLQ